ncbi:MAG: TetR/AcrR family transcriptional regulator [Rhodospirillaceae bacterium]
MARNRVRARSPEDQEIVRRRFIDCARKVFSETGAHGLTMRRLAAEAGYSPGTIYLYFPSRRDLLREVWKEDMVALRERFAAAVEAGTPLERVRALCHCWADFWFDQPDHFKAMFLEVERQYVSERAAFAEDESVQDLHTLFVTHTAAAVEVGELAAMNPVVLTHSLLAAIHGVVALHIGNAGFPWADRKVMVETVVNAMLRGLAPAA